MRRAVAAEVVARDHAGEAAALRRARDVDELADRERVDADDVARLELRELVGRDRKFLQHVAGFDTRLREVAGHAAWSRATRDACRT